MKRRDVEVDLERKSALGNKNGFNNDVYSLFFRLKFVKKCLFTLTTITQEVDSTISYLLVRF